MPCFYCQAPVDEVLFVLDPAWTDQTPEPVCPPCGSGAEADGLLLFDRAGNEIPQPLEVR